MNIFKKSVNKKVVIGTCLGVTFFLIFSFIFNLSLKKPAQYISPIIPNVQSAAVITQTGLPISLQIPNLKVDVVLKYVDVTASGAMDIPKSINDVAWFEPGTRPGEIGSAVMAGHYGKKAGKSSVFDNLSTLKAGDKLYITDDKGVLITFVVRKSRSYEPNADAFDVFNSSDGKAHLNLITCEGTWDKVSKSYSKRLVVFTDKE